MSDIRKTVTAADLVHLRDFGGQNIRAAEPLFSLSPDGKRIALILRQASVAQNSYCANLLIVSIAGKSSPAIVADAGEITRATFDKYGIAGLGTGMPKVSPVIWSADGRSLFWTQERAGRSEIWRVGADGQGARALFSSSIPVDDLQSAKDGAIVFSSRPDLTNRKDNLVREGMSGYHYDHRFWPLDSMTPYPAAPMSATVEALDPKSGAVSPATAAQRATLDRTLAPGWPIGADDMKLSSRSGAMAWTSLAKPDTVAQPTTLHVRSKNGEVFAPPDQGRGILGFWWLSDGRGLLILEREGEAGERSALYRWEFGARRSRRLLSTDDVLLGCQLATDQLVCAREASIQPRELVAIDSRTGKERNLFDPNPEWRQIVLGRVRRLLWRNAFGIPAFADLVLPPGYKYDRRLPLIVVQYESRGFLRGGTADVYPIELFAAHGFAVLSFNRPAWFALTKAPMGWDAFLKTNQQDWADRRSVESSLETVVRQLIDGGTVDPARIGITGQSDGASTATFALIHSDLFSAVALSTCCEDQAIMTSLGPGFAETYRGYGYPESNRPAAAFWSESSLDMHSDRRPVPLLIQASDQEARMALPTFQTLKDAGWPVDMYVFPDESHVIFWPAHRLAIYERSLAWFERWIGARTNDPAQSHENSAYDEGQAAAQASASTRSRIRP